MESKQEKLLKLRTAKLEKELAENALELENKNREFEIEAALEKVRSRSLTMHHSEELKEVAAVVFDMLLELDVAMDTANICVHIEGSRDVYFWVAEAGQSYSTSFFVPYHNTLIASDFWNARDSGVDFFTKDYTVEEKNTYWRWAFENSTFKSLPQYRKDRVLESDYYTFWAAFERNSTILVTSFLGKQLSEKENGILKRFAKVFEQAYIRFLDLQRAEMQAREGQIQLALERVRARTMAMQRSEELAETVFILFQQFKDLGENPDQATIGIINEDERVIEYWVTLYGSQTNRVFKFPFDEPNVTHKIYEAWKAQKKSLVIDLSGKELFEFMTYRAGMGGAAVNKAEKRRIINVAFFSKGLINVQSTVTRSEESVRLLERFAGVFEGTYTRFLDLKKAEEQAREAMIEVSLERVRSKTMAMHNSQDVGDTVALLFDELIKLGVEPTVRSGVAIIDKSKHMEVWTAFTKPDGQVTLDIGRLDMTTHPLLQHTYNGWESNKSSASYVLSGDDLKSYFKTLNDAPDYHFNHTSDVLPEKWYNNCFFFPEGCLFIFDSEPLPAEVAQLFKRFAGVFGLTYRRYLDLQKAEAQARESRIETALERVRSKTMAMHSSQDVGNTVVAMFDELVKLDIETIRCGILIGDETDEMEVWTAKSNADGEATLTIGRLDMLMHPMLQGVNDAWKNKEQTFEYELVGEDLKKYYQAINNSNYYPAKFDMASLRSREFHTDFFFLDGSIFAFTIEPIPADKAGIFKRFAGVFGQTYRRYLDLQRAEAQAKESRIEAGLERLRSKTMAMHNSNDVGETVAAMFDECIKLGVDRSVRCGVGIIDETKQMEVWTAYADADGKIDFIIGNLDMTTHPMLLGVFDSWKNKEWHSSYLLAGEDQKAYYRAINQSKEYDAHFKLGSLPAQQSQNAFYFPEGFIYVFSHDPLSIDSIQIFKRFAGVFGLTYRRFLDLQKAEAQAREGKIETALERVRSRTMAMQQSTELAETSVEVFKQLIGLGIVPNRLFIGIIKDDSGDIELWATDEDGSKLTSRFTGNKDRNLSVKKMYDGWKQQKSSIIIDMKGAELKNYFNYLGHELKVPFKLGLSQKRRVQMVAYFSQGFIGMASPLPQPDETCKLMERFAGVFNLTYTRFNDLQKAEAQARDAKIETAMERVRARAMAMQQPGELKEVAQVLRYEMASLGVEELETCSIYILDENTRNAECWYAIKDARGNEKGLVADYFPLDLEETWVGREMLNFYNSGSRHTSILMTGDNRKEWIRYCEEFSVALRGFYADVVPDRTYHLYKFSHGAIGAATPGEISRESWRLLKRAASVFSLAYTRFLALKQAQEQAHQAVKQASIDRIRAEIASMRTTTDLERITPLIWNELTILNVPFIRCGVFIMDEPAELIHYYLSTPDGRALGVFHLPFNAAGIGQNVLLNWRAQHIFKTHWTETEFTAYTKSLVEQGVAEPEEKYITEHPPTTLDLHFFPFLQGMLYVGNVVPLAEDEMSLVQSLAAAFSTAYARYEDFNRLESAKLQVENTLTELQATQTKLIQSEKMASLGELTAGIAHEIQNPLNFVNNFSEVNQEMIDELQEELRSGNIDEALALSAEIKQNEEKINHHGKRADGIVKGMLQHSRTGGGEKEPTNMNAIADEFMRLSYHGLRSKDKSFNAEMVTDFDPKLPKINAIPQDMGRVMLNLFNNAFYAVNQKKKTAGDDYKPEVSVSTSTENGQVIIKVKDNGVGIPDPIKEKIMQPFFTTKPTGEGTGLGLSLTYDMVVKGHGGKIEVSTKEGQYTEFTVSLPIS